MTITDLDKVITAEDARKISLNNKDDSLDRKVFRDLMDNIQEQASWGYTRYTTAPWPTLKENIANDIVLAALQKLGFKVQVKRAMKWNEEKKEFFSDRPSLNSEGRETYFIEVMWG